MMPKTLRQAQAAYAADHGAHQILSKSAIDAMEQIRISGAMPAMLMLTKTVTVSIRLTAATQASIIKPHWSASFYIMSLDVTTLTSSNG
jgi:hypothetical protein